MNTQHATEFVGFCRRAGGHWALIGMGPEDWLRDHIPFDGYDFVMHAPSEADLHDSGDYIERDLSGGSLG